MKLIKFYSILCFLFIYGCSSKALNPDFIKKTSGRYLFNSDEIIEVYFENQELYINWRGANKIKPLKIENNTYFVKEMNEKIKFSNNYNDSIEYLYFIPKSKKDSLVSFIKLASNQKIPSEYLANNQFDKALDGYLNIQKKDSLDKNIAENNFNKLGYHYLRDKKYQKAINIFKINVALYPNSSNVYDSLGEAYLKKSDTTNAIINYKKSLTLNNQNKRAKEILNKIVKK